MPSNAFAGVGTVFNRASTPIAEIHTITGPGMTRNTIDVTSLDSTGGYKEFIGGFRDGGTVVLAMNFTKASYSIMKGDFDSDTLQTYNIALPDGTSFDFDGVVTDLSMGVPTDDKVTSDCTIKVSGPVTLNS